jgi:hypothetical protein
LSGSLASRHARNAMFGGENCYVCHADYGMFGTIVTKAGGMRHVWLYLTEYRNTPVEESKKTIRLREPGQMNDNCMECHSTEDTLWLKVPDHRAERWLVVACVCALAALALMSWQIFDPTVWPVMVAMSLGQVLGTASLAAFGFVVVQSHLAKRKSQIAKTEEPEP